MARQRRRRHRNRSTAARLDRHYRHRSRITEEVMRGEQYRESQSEFMKAFRHKLKEAAETTVFITNVRDLNNLANTSALRTFLAQTYGPILSCEPHRRNKQRYPSAVVRFKYGADAARMFGVESLLDTDNQSIRLPCPVGHRGSISARRHRYVDAIARKEMTSPVIEFSASRLSLGHWYTHEEVYDGNAVDSGVWLEVETACKVSPQQSDNGAQQSSVFQKFFAQTFHAESSSSASKTKKEVVSPTIQIDLVKRQVRILSYSTNLPEIMIFRFKQLKSPMRLCKDKSGSRSITFSLKYPPTLEREEIVLPYFDTRTVRQVSWAAVEAETFGNCLGYKISLEEISIQALQQHVRYADLRSFGVLDLDYPQDFESRFIGWSDEKLWAEKVANVANVRLRILLSSLRDAGCFCAYDAINDAEGTAIFEVVQQYDPELAEKALEIMLGHRAKTRIPRQWFFDTVESLRRDEPFQTLPDHCVSIPKVLVTPTRVITAGFEVETSNRAIRLFHHSHDFPLENFARIQVVDEDMSPIFAHDLGTQIEQRLRNTIKSGLSVAGLQFDFLAYSSSQLREASFWAVSIPSWTELASIEDMRKQLGEITEKTTSKYAARLGQCFSTTFCEPQRSQKLYPRFADTKVPDIFGARGCHSDGTGLITRAAMNRVLLSVPFAPEDPLEVGIIQIRFRGSKGTLVAWDDPHKWVGGTLAADVMLRDSMIKFSSEHNDIEVCSIGKRVPYHLNRNVIFLLNALGVPTNVFTFLQRDMLDMLDKMLWNREHALHVLPSLSGIDSAKKAMLLHMLHSGLSPQNEPFLYSALASIRCHHLFNLRKKSRICVEKGAVLMGGLDETGLLEEGTVFFQVKDGTSKDAEYKPLLGPVLVTKHPVMHPGDLRMLLAVDVPELRCCRNVLLFSQRGDRPEADKMANSDLDGDEFAVTWDERLFLGEWNQCKRVDGNEYVSIDGFPLFISDLTAVNFEPMDPVPGGEKKNTNFVPKDADKASGALIDHLVDHIKNASVGQICGLWWDYASKEGPLRGVCLQLAELHAVAVDYPKSGVPAQVPKEYLWKETPRAHWREKGGVSFHCDSVIGRLYDAVISRLDLIDHETRDVVALAGRQKDKYGTVLCECSIDFERVNNDAEKSHPHYQRFISAKLGLARDPERQQRLVKIALHQKMLYNQELIQLMNTHRIRGEGEVYTGCIRKYHKLYKKRQNEFAQDIRRRYGLICIQHRKLFFRLVVALINGQHENETGNSTEEDGTMGPNDEGAGMIDAFKEGGGEDSDESTDGTELESDEEMIHRLLSQEDENLDKEASWVEQVVLSLEEETMAGDSKQSAVVAVAFALAGAWYEAAYCPELQEGTTRLFSFPWIIADVIVCGLTEKKNFEHERN